MTRRMRKKIDRREAECKEKTWRKNNRKHDMQEGDRGESDSREGGGTMGYEMRKVHVTRGKVKGMRKYKTL